MMDTECRLSMRRVVSVTCCSQSDQMGFLHKQRYLMHAALEQLRVLPPVAILPTS